LKNINANDNNWQQIEVLSMVPVDPSSLREVLKQLKNRVSSRGEAGKRFEGERY
jgi:hypothetical protein